MSDFFDVMELITNKKDNIILSHNTLGRRASQIKIRAMKTSLNLSISSIKLNTFRNFIDSIRSMDIDDKYKVTVKTLEGKALIEFFDGKTTMQIDIDVERKRPILIMFRNGIQISMMNTKNSSHISLHKIMERINPILDALYRKEITKNPFKVNDMFVREEGREIEIPAQEEVEMWIANHGDIHEANIRQ